jgi:predicted CoA-substrate-specific enzyme activase
MIAAGIDVGAGTAKAVILRDGRIVASAVVPVTGNVSQAVEKVTGAVLQAAGVTLESLDYVLSTGWGRSAVPFARKTSSEIICHAAGVHFLVPGARTIIDIGAQDSKFIRVNDRGEVIDFAMNEKCAAGTGRFIEVMGHVLGLKLEEMGPISLASRNPCAISNTCTVFAETEVVSLRAEGKSVEDLVAGIHKAIATRIGIMGSRLKFVKNVVFTGGVAKNTGVKKALEETSGLEVIIPPDPQITGALGAALLAGVELGKNRRVPVL